MQIAISLENGQDMKAKASGIFGRCAYFMVINPESGDFKIESNPAREASGGAGIQAAQWIIDQGVQAVLTGSLGPKAFDVLSAAKIAAYKHDGGSAEGVLAAYQAGKLECMITPNVDAHTGAS